MAGAYLQLPCRMGLHCLTSVLGSLSDEAVRCSPMTRVVKVLTAAAKNKWRQRARPAAAAPAHRLRRPSQPPGRQQPEVPDSSRWPPGHSMRSHVLAGKMWLLGSRLCESALFRHPTR